MWGEATAYAVVVCKHILVFSLSLSHAEQQQKQQDQQTLGTTY